jgi:5-methylcytosine-specific restriction protein A
MPTYQDRRLGSRERGYTTKWDREAAEYRTAHPFCLGCEAIGRRERTTIVDHIQPHRGSQPLFWNRRNWQPSCEWHHNTVKKALEALWDQREIGLEDLRLDSARAIALTKKTPRKETIGVDGWPVA